MHGVALASINNTENQHHDHAGNTAMILGTTYNIPTDTITGSATHHEVPIVRRDQRPGTASTPSSFVALEDDMRSGARTGFGTATCIVRRRQHVLIITFLSTIVPTLAAAGRRDAAASATRHTHTTPPRRWATTGGRVNPRELSRSHVVRQHRGTANRGRHTLGDARRRATLHGTHSNSVRHAPLVVALLPSSVGL